MTLKGLDSHPHYTVLLGINSQSPDANIKEASQHPPRECDSKTRRDLVPVPPPLSANQFLMRLADFKQGSDSALLPQRWMYYRRDELSVLYLPPSSTRRFHAHTVDPALFSLIRFWRTDSSLSSPQQNADGVDYNTSYNQAPSIKVMIKTMWADGGFLYMSFIRIEGFQQNRAAHSACEFYFTLTFP